MLVSIQTICGERDCWHSWTLQKVGCKRHYPKVDAWPPPRLHTHTAESPPTIAGPRQPVSIHPEGFFERLWPATLFSQIRNVFVFEFLARPDLMNQTPWQPFALHATAGYTFPDLPLYHCGPHL